MDFFNILLNRSANRWNGNLKKPLTMIKMEGYSTVKGQYRSWTRSDLYMAL